MALIIRPGEAERWFVLCVITLSEVWTTVLLNGPVIHTRYGKIRGVYTDTSSISYYGIPYAQPPIGLLRWESPKNPSNWGRDIYIADKFKPSCPQTNCHFTDLCPDEKFTSEDCLYINVFTPRGQSLKGSGWPVMLYIHPGAFHSLSASIPLLDGRFLASNNVIVVTLNYRLGVFGFLTTGESHNHARGNYGILDQQQAMKWVHENIHSFGGDATKVTLFGHSAGAESILIHLFLPYSVSLFHQAIMESPPIGMPYLNNNEAVLLGQLLTERLDCPVNNSMNCLKSKTTENVLHASIQAYKLMFSPLNLRYMQPFAPVINNHMIQDAPFRLIERGEYHAKPLIIGVTADEAAAFDFFIPKLGSIMSSIFISSGASFLPTNTFDFYSMDSLLPDDQGQQFIRALTDATFVCPSQYLAKTLVKQGQADVWFYIFDYKSAIVKKICSDYVCHGSDIIYRFRTENSTKFINYNFTPQDETISRIMVNYWTNFATNGNPNKFDNAISGKRIPTWPRYSMNNNWTAIRYRLPECDWVENYNADVCENLWDITEYKF